MKVFFTVLIALFTTSIYGNSYLNLSCFPQVFNVLGLKKEAKIKFYNNLKLEGEPILVLSDKFYFKGDSVGHSVFLDKKRKQTNKELFEKLPELIKRKEGVFIVFCPTATKGIFQFKSNIGELYFELKSDDKFLNAGSFLIEDQKEIKVLMSKHTGFRKGSEEYLECIKQSGNGCNEKVGENVKLLLTFLTRIKDKSCLAKPKGLSAQFSNPNSEPELLELEDPLIIPKSLTVSKEVMDEAIGIFQLTENKNIYYYLRLYIDSFENEGSLFSIFIYHYKKVDCFKPEGIIIRSDYTYGNIYRIIFDYPAGGD